MYSVLPLEGVVCELDACAVPLAAPPVVDIDVDAQRMLRVAAGDQRAYAELVQRHQRPLLNFFARMGAYAECEDLAQATFVRLFRYRDRYKAAARFTTFLYVLARRVWLDHGRKDQRRKRLSAQLQQDAETARQVETAGQGVPVDVEAALDRLSPKLREAIVLNIYQGLRYQEIADVLSIPLGTVKSRINLALNALREFIHEH